MESGEIKLSLPPHPRTHSWFDRNEAQGGDFVETLSCRVIRRVLEPELRDQDYSLFFDNFLIESFLSPSIDHNEPFSNLTVCS